MDKLEEVLCGERGPLVLRTLSRLAMSEALDSECRSVVPLIIELQLGEQRSTEVALTDFGHKCADAAREYGFWTQRQRRLHGETTLPALLLSNFADKRVLEIGPGWGCNLFRLQQVTPHVRGREIEETYVRFTSIFARIEGVQAPVIDIGGGEQLPYPDASFDCVLLFSALQYMEIGPTVVEITRVLAPGGRLISSQPTLSVLCADLARALRAPRTVPHKAMTMVNSLAFGVLGRRLRATEAGSATSRPVYLTRRQLIALFERSGLGYLPELSGMRGRDFLLVASKP